MRANYAFKRKVVNQGRQIAMLSRRPCRQSLESQLIEAIAEVEMTVIE